MNSKIIYEKIPPSNSHIVREVLQKCELPFSDIEPSKDILFIVAKDLENVVGTIGLEVYGKEALLRSLAVIPEYRNKGIASELIQRIVQVAKSVEIDTFHLLTTTAEQYFLRKGFRKDARENAPLPIQATSEFAGLCPSSAIYMVLHLSR
jgi:amino-acid N-acetyltransferase